MQNEGLASPADADVPEFLASQIRDVEAALVPLGDDNRQP